MEQSRLNELLILEDRILEDRRMLVNMTREMNNPESEFIKRKLATLEIELQHMSGQIDYMKRKCASSQQSVVNQSVINESVNNQPVNNRPVPEMSVPRVTAQAGPKPAVPTQAVPTQAAPTQTVPTMAKPAVQMPAVQSSVVQTPVKQTPINQTQYNGESDFEKTFGKSFMGIAASVLIFISIILFATLLLPMLGDGAKMAIMYIVSGAFLGIGAYRLNKDKDNKFNISLTGCGLGALFISLLLSNIYFKVLGDIPLYVLIAFWGCLVCIFAKNKNYIFQVIGEIGILIATIFGCLLCLEERDTTKFIALLVFYGITSAIFYLVNYEEEYFDNLCYHFFALIGSIVITAACERFSEMEGTIVHIIACVILLLNIVGSMSHKLDKEQVCFGTFTSVHIICMALITSYIVPDEAIWGIVVYVSAMIMTFVISFKKSELQGGLNTLSTTCVLIAFVGLIVNGSAYTYGFIWLMIIPLLVYGYVRNQLFYKVISLIMIYVYLFVHDYDQGVIHYIYMLVVLTVAYVCMNYFKKQYEKTQKGFLYAAVILFVGIYTYGFLADIFGYGDNTHEVIMTVVYVCYFLVNVLCYKVLFAYNYATGEKEENHIVFSIANLVAMGWGLALVSNGGSPAIHFINILVAFAAFMLKTKSALEQKDGKLSLNLYVGLKFTIFLITVLSSLDAANYVISIGCLLLAILLILVGFKGGYKYLRIYGLGLTMLSIFKLLMIDVKYENTLGNALSFFVSGILCFAISMTYNYLDKKMKD